MDAAELERMCKEAIAVAVELGFKEDKIQRVDWS
jgi:hypothetical protein